jgi:hypothetical protein
MPARSWRPDHINNLIIANSTLQPWVLEHAQEFLALGMRSIGHQRIVIGRLGLKRRASFRMQRKTLHQLPNIQNPGPIIFLWTEGTVSILRVT